MHAGLTKYTHTHTRARARARILHKLECTQIVSRLYAVCLKQISSRSTRAIVVLNETIQVIAAIY